MSKIKTPVDNLRAERLKSMIKQEGKTQAEFGKFPDGTHLSQQAISGILNGHNALTEATAKLIISYYPEYRFEWLMGYDDYVTHADLEAHKQAQRDAYWRNVDDYTKTIERLIDLTVERINNHTKRKRKGKQIDNIDELGKAFLACQLSDYVQMIVKNYADCSNDLDNLLTNNMALRFFRQSVHAMDKNH